MTFNKSTAFSNELHELHNVTFKDLSQKWQQGIVGHYQHLITLRIIIQYNLLFDKNTTKMNLSTTSTIPYSTVMGAQI